MINNNNTNKPLGLQKRRKPETQNSQTSMNSNNANINDTSADNDNNEQLADATTDNASSMFIDEMMDIVGPALDVFRENGIDDSIQNLTTWRENMMSLGIDPDNKDIRAAAIAALSMVAFSDYEETPAEPVNNQNNDNDNNNAGFINDSGNAQLQAISLMLAICENNVDAVNEYNAQTGFDEQPDINETEPVNTDNANEPSESSSNANDDNNNVHIIDDRVNKQNTINGIHSSNNGLKPVVNHNVNNNADNTRSNSNTANVKRGLPRLRPHK